MSYIEGTTQPIKTPRKKVYYRVGEYYKGNLISLYTRNIIKKNHLTKARFVSKYKPLAKIARNYNVEYLVVITHLRRHFELDSFRQTPLFGLFDSIKDALDYSETVYIPTKKHLVVYKVTASGQFYTTEIYNRDKETITASSEITFKEIVWRYNDNS